MRHQVSVEQQTRSRTATGGLANAWAAITGGSSIWAELRPLSPFEIDRYAHTVGKVSHRLRVRVGEIAAITTRMRVTYGSRHFAVVGVTQPDEQSRFYDVQLAETISGGPTDGEGD